MKVMQIIDAIRRIIKSIVGWCVVILLLWMICLGMTTLLMRWMSLQPPVWLDLQLRQMVLWVGLLGGILAAANDRHIRIDILDHYLNESLKNKVKIIINSIAGIGSLFLSWLAVIFVNSEKSYGRQLEGFLFGLMISEWLTEMILPISFGLMSFYFLTAFRPLSRTGKAE